MRVDQSKETFRGIKPSAKVEALAMTTYQCHVAGVPVQLGFEAVQENIPLFMALPHLDGMGALIDLPKRVIHFTKLSRYNIPLHRLGKGHLGVRLDDVHGDEGSGRPPDELILFGMDVQEKQQRACVKTAGASGGSTWRSCSSAESAGPCASS